jgi:cell division inhibitor SulA
VGLADSLAKAKETSRKGSMCFVCKLLPELNDEDHAELVAALQDVTVYSTVIGKALRLEGHKVADDTIQRHRRGGCVGR